MSYYNKKKVVKIIDKYLSGKEISRSEKIFHNNILHVKKANIIYNYTNDEIFEMFYCSADIYYFIKNFLNLKLHKYQIDIINHYIKYKHIIFMPSRNIGFIKIISIIFLWECIFKKNISILILSKKSIININFLNELKNYYLKLPFYMKPGIKSWEQKRLLFDNGNNIYTNTVNSQNLNIGYNLSRIIILDVAFIKDNIITNLYKFLMPSLSVLKNSKIVIVSQPNNNNKDNTFFKTLVNNSVLPNKHPDANSYKLKCIYWWEIPDRDKNWKKEQIKILGEDDFNTYYNLKFIPIRSKKLRRIIEN